MTAAFQSVSKLVFTMEIVLNPTHALAKRVGPAMIAVCLSVHRNATTENVSLLTHANAISGRMNGEMAVLAVEFHCSRSLTVTRK